MSDKLYKIKSLEWKESSTYDNLPRYLDSKANFVIEGLNTDGTSWRWKYCLVDYYNEDSGVMDETLETVKKHCEDLWIEYVAKNLIEV